MPSHAESLRFTAFGAADEAVSPVLAAISRAVERLGARAGWSDALVYRVNLVLDELASNVLSHGVSGEPPAAALEIDLVGSSGEARIDVADDGPAFDPVAAPAPVALDPGAPVPVGGLGLHLVRTVAACVTYRREAGRNRVRLLIRAE